VFDVFCVVALGVGLSFWWGFGFWGLRWGGLGGLLRSGWWGCGGWGVVGIVGSGWVVGGGVLLGRGISLGFVCQGGGRVGFGGSFDVFLVVWIACDFFAMVWIFGWGSGGFAPLGLVFCGVGCRWAC